MARAASIVFADTDRPEGLGRVVNALTTAKEFKEAGDEAVVIFDGAGTKWVAELAREDHKYHGLFEEVRDVVGGACSYCAAAYGGGRAHRRAAARGVRRPPEPAQPHRRRLCGRHLLGAATPRSRTNPAGRWRLLRDRSRVGFRVKKMASTRRVARRASG